MDLLSQQLMALKAKGRSYCAVEGGEEKIWVTNSHNLKGLVIQVLFPPTPYTTVWLRVVNLDPFDVELKWLNVLSI